MIITHPASQHDLMRTIETELPNLSPDERFWWRTTGNIFAHLVQQAGYSIESQYAALLFYRSKIVPSLGERPLKNGKPRAFKSYTTDDCSPIEYSWDWNGFESKPSIRFAIEAIDKDSGTPLDPFNQRKSRELFDALHAVSPTFRDTELFRHFWNSLLVSDIDSTAINERAEPQSHRSSLFIACEFDEVSDCGRIKVYFLPMLRALQMNQTRTQLLSQAVSDPLVMEHSPVLRSLMDFLEEDPLGSQSEIEMVSVDCVEPKEARIKVYPRLRQTSWNSVAAMLTMNGRIDVDKSLMNDLRALWRLVLDLDDSISDADELPECFHSTAGVLYCFHAKPGDKQITPKLYLPAKHYGKHDRSIMNGVTQYVRERGQSTSVQNYEKVLEAISSHRRLEDQCGIHSYISCRFGPSSILLTSYMSPEIYHPARWCKNSENRGL